MSNQSGELYIVATPIGNLDDLSIRAKQVLTDVDLIAAEDTRHSRKLVSHFGITTPMTSYHDHNEHDMSQELVSRLKKGMNIALISDAGTPLISDPGYLLVSLAHTEGIKVLPVPGASAMVAALSVSGLATDRFIFEGFLPEKKQARRSRLEDLETEKRTLVFYEAPHRIRALLEDCVETLGGDRQACIARELSKVYETVRKDSLEALLSWIEDEERQRKGEFVLCIEGNSRPGTKDEAELRRTLGILLQSLALNEAVRLAVELTGAKKNELYSMALQLKEEASEEEG